MSRKFKRRKNAVLILAMLPVLLAIALLVYRNIWFLPARQSSQRTLDQELQTARDLGLYLSVDELAKQYEQQAGGAENAAPLEEVFKALPSQADKLDAELSMLLPYVGDYELLPGKIIAPANLEALKNYIDTNDEVLSKLKQILETSESYFWIEIKSWPDIGIAHFWPLRQCARMLCMESLYLCATGDCESAAESIGYVFRLARTIQHEPFHISKSVFVSLQSLAASAMVDCMGRCPATEPVLNLFEQQLAGLDGRSLIKQLCQANAVFGLESLQRLEAGGSVYSVPSDPFGGMSVTIGTKATLYYLRAAGNLSRFKAQYLHSLNRQYQLADLDWKQSRLEWSKPEVTLENVSAPEKLLLIQMGASWGDSVSELGRRIEAIKELALTACAVERHHLRSGSAPEQLSSLVPDLLTEVPQDPFTGADIKYIKSSDGYQIYSLGKDVQDDRQDFPQEAPAFLVRHGGDITLTVKRSY